MSMSHVSNCVRNLNLLPISKTTAHMQQRSFFLLVVLLCIILQRTFPFVAADLLQLPSTPRLASGPPLVKTNWVILNSNATTDGYSYPRVASFKSGNYAIIFGYSAANYTSVTQVRLVNATNGAIYSVSEAEYSTVAEVGPLLGPMTAQNLVIFPDDNALAIWQMKGLAKCVGFSFTEDYFLPSTNIIYQDIGVWNATDYLDIAGSSWSHYAIGYSGDTDVSNFLYKNPDVTTQVLPSSFGSGTTIHSAVTRKLYSGYPTIFSFVVYSSQGGYFTLQSLNVGATLNYDDTVINATKAIPFVLDDLDIVAGLFVTSDGRIQLLAFDTIAVSALYQINVTRYADSNFSPSVLQLSNNVVLVAFSTSYNRINYQMVKLSRTTAVLVGPEVTHDAPSTTMSVSMASTIGSDVIVVAKDVTGTQIMSRTITFCGNGALDLKEECDGSLGCIDHCKCQFGTVAVNGTCVDQCNNGIATGYEDCDSGTGCVDCKCAPGYIPMSPRAQGCQLIPKEFVPNVKPQFDCLETTANGLLLHFSFINNDGFDETIQYGGLNSFTPTSLGKDRPTLFVAGQSLTYPVSPYSTEVTNDTRSITWILSSYNLTVDLTKPSLECPKSLSVDLTLSTFGNLTDALVQKLLQNIASKYNISESRLSAEYTLVSTNSQGLSTYLIIVTVNASTSSEESSVSVVKDLLDDIQKSKDEFDSDLTKGLEEVNPVIKSVTPSIIESRGTSTPISVFTPAGTPSLEQMSEASAVCIQLAVIYSLMIAYLTVL